MFFFGSQFYIGLHMITHVYTGLHRPTLYASQSVYELLEVSCPISKLANKSKEMHSSLSRQLQTHIRDYIVQPSLHFLSCQVCNDHLGWGWVKQIGIELIEGGDFKREKEKGAGYLSTRPPNLPLPPPDLLPHCKFTGYLIILSGSSNLCKILSNTMICLWAACKASDCQHP